jgi:hypothetical protein
MKPSIPITETAKDAYIEKRAAVMSELERIAAAVQAMPEPDSQVVGWGHVGDLGYVLVELKKLLPCKQVANNDR